MILIFIKSNFENLKRKFSKFKQFHTTMNQSVSTLTGKIKIKIVFIGDQAVGKSSVIEKYVHNRFDQNAHVVLFLFNQQ